MGTNYYFDSFDAVLRAHIGKSSYGWCFALHVYPELSINNLADWQRKFPDGIITDEHGLLISSEEMTFIITDREKFFCPASDDRPSKEWFIDSQTGLLRRTVDMRFCIGNGDGPFDYLTGNFC